MANLKDLKNRITSVKSTQKITKAMQMVAASKLKRAQERAEQARPYSEKMERMLITLSGNTNIENAPKLLSGNRNAAGEPMAKTHLIVVISADRGLCGGFNGSIVKGVIARVNELQAQGKQVKIFTVGKKAKELLRYSYPKLLVEHYSTSDKKQMSYKEAQEVAERVIALFEAGEADVCSVVYNKFINAITQKVTFQQLIPLDVSAIAKKGKEEGSGLQGTYEYEPSEEVILEDLLPTNIGVQVFHAMLESSASEQGARMTAMDNATRNAGDMIKKLTLKYNRTRQAAITTELTEIIAGAESV